MESTPLTPTPSPPLRRERGALAEEGKRWDTWGTAIGSILAFSVVWPHTLFLISAATEAYLGLALVYLFITKRRPQPIPWPIALAFLFILAMAVQVPRAADMGYGWHELEKKLCWVALPLACWLRPPGRREWEGIAYHFIWAVLLLIPVAYALAARRHQLHPEAWYVFEGTSLVYPFQLHRVVLAMQTLVALLLCLRLGPRLFGRWWWLPALLLLFWHVTLASRTGLISTGVLLLAGLAWLVLKRRWLPAGLIALAGLAAGALALSRPSTLSKLGDLKPGRSLPAPDSVNINDSYATRYYIWKAAESLIRENPVLGVGTGNVEPRLAQAYAEEGYALGVQYRFNAHNQYLQTWLDSGLVGLLLLVAMLLAPAMVGWRRGDWLGPAFSLMWALVISTESMNEVSRCAVVFALFFGMYAAVQARSSKPSGPVSG